MIQIVVCFNVILKKSMLLAYIYNNINLLKYVLFIYLLNSIPSFNIANYAQHYDPIIANNMLNS